MKKNPVSTVRYFLTLFFIVANINAIGQVPQARTDTMLVKNYQEKLFIQTDRQIYITGEQVWVKVYKFDRLTGLPSDISKVIYLELIDRSDNPVNRIRISSPGIAGASVFTLSDTLSSGNYMIRAYTKWMLNYSEDLFAYGTITVINPFKKIDQLVLKPGTDSVRKGSGNSGTGEAVKNPVEGPGSDKLNIKIEADRNAYDERQDVHINIMATDSKGKPVEADMSISVVKSALADTGKAYSQHMIENVPEAPLLRNDSCFLAIDNLYNKNILIHGKQNPLVYITKKQPLHLPEIEGPVLSGIIRSKASNEPLKNVPLALSILGKTSRCLFTSTNEKGEFNFVFNNIPGRCEIVIQPLSDECTDSYVELSQPFSNTFNGYSPSGYYPDSSIIKSINNAVIGVQIKSVYEQFRQKQQVKENTVSLHNFYGDADKTIIMSNYIQLTDVREIVKELLPEVRVIKRNNKYNFRIINSYPYPSFENDALVLVDGVPVYDIANLLDVNSGEIEKIDIINRRYYLSDYIFDGILSFVTKKGNLTEMKSDSYVYRQFFEGFKPRYTFYSPDYSIDSLRKSHIPDFRNTLYWNPELNSGRDGKAQAGFFTSDEPGRYTITVEGVTSEGINGISSVSFVVK